MTRSGKTAVPELSDYLLSKDFTATGFKGEGLSFREWDHQLRHRMLIAGVRSLVSMSPQASFLHPTFLTDTVGYDSRRPSANSQ